MPSETNPLLEPSTLPYQLPPFALIEDEHYLPAFDVALAEQRTQIADIIASDDEPSFVNTMIALESSGQALRRVAAVFFNRSSSDSSEFIAGLEETLAPILSAHDDAIRLNPALYARISALHEHRHGLGLDPQSMYLIERYYNEFTLAGARLDDDDRAVLSGLNQQLSALTTRFEKNLLADTNDLAVLVADAAQLDGLDAGEIAAAAAAAAERGLDAGYLLTLVLPTGHPALAALTDRAMRHRLMHASRSRGRRGNDFDTEALVLDIVRLRARRARLLGFPDHASTVAAGQTARTPEAVAAMLETLAPAAARNARAELAQLETVAGSSVESWDWAFYSEQVRRDRYDIDTAEMRPYFELERVLHDGVFFAASRLYGLRFVERHDLTAYHPDARVFEVFAEDDSPLGLYLGDYFTRDSKRGGAWMNALVSGSSLLGTPTVVVNNLNLPKPATGEPALLTFDEVTTLFHEFGHALHGLFGHTVYPKFSGTSVFRDFVEFPSQVNEMWVLWPEVLENYAVHHETAEPMPRELVDRVTASAAFNQGFATSEYLAAALLDQAWHRLDVEAAEAVTDVEAFEAQALARVGLDLSAVPPRYSTSYFAHTFSGGYDAGYYSYIWSEVLDADTVEWFRENGGLTRANGDRFRELVLGVGGSSDPLEAYRSFRGRNAAIEPLLARRGLDV